jgi:hypothetical protein
VNKGTPQKYPPTTKPRQELVDLVGSKWDQYGIKPVDNYIGSPVGMMRHWWKTGDDS